MTTATTNPIGSTPAAAVIAKLQGAVAPATPRPPMDVRPKTPKAKAAKPDKAVKAKGKTSKTKVTRGPNTPRFVTIKGVRHEITHYKKTLTANGNTSLDSGDELAKDLRGLELAEVYTRASKALKVPVAELKAKYATLNAGMQRMNLGNRMRAAAIRAKAAN